MKVDIITNYDSLYKQHSSDSIFREKKHANNSLCESVDKNVNRGYYSGSSVSFGAAANISKKMQALNKLWDLSAGSTVVAQNLVALVLAAVLRPIAIVSLPGKKNKDDKIYASGHSISSGLIGFGFASVVMYPFDKAAKIIKQNPKKYLTDLSKKIYKVDNLEDLHNSKIFKNVEKMFNMGHDALLFGVVKAMLTVALIPPVLKYVFGVEKNKGQKPEAPKAEATKNAVLPEVSPLQKPNIAKFLGGEK